MWGKPAHPYGSTSRLWGESSQAVTHHIVSVTETVSPIIEVVARTPLGAVGGVAAHIGRLYGKVFNSHTTQGS